MQDFSTLSRRAILVVTAVAWVCLGLAPHGARAADATIVTADAAATAPAATPELNSALGEVAPGLWVFLDPETGKITDRPTPEQMAAIRAQMSQLVVESTAGLVGRTYPNGMKSLDLQGRFQSVSIVTLDANGKQHMTCAETPDEAASALFKAPRQVPMLNGLETE